MLCEMQSASSRIELVSITITPRAPPCCLFYKLRLILFCDRVVYYYTRIFQIFLPYPMVLDKITLSLLGFVHNWLNRRWSAKKKKKKRKSIFIKRKWNNVVFSRVTILSFSPVESSYGSWDLYTIGQRVDGLQQKKKTGFH